MSVLDLEQAVSQAQGRQRLEAAIQQRKEAMGRQAYPYQDPFGFDPTQGSPAAAPIPQQASAPPASVAPPTSAGAGGPQLGTGRIGPLGLTGGSRYGTGSIGGGFARVKPQPKMPPPQMPQLGGEPGMPTEPMPEQTRQEGQETAKSGIQKFMDIAQGAASGAKEGFEEGYGQPRVKGTLRSFPGDIKRIIEADIGGAFTAPQGAVRGGAEAAGMSPAWAARGGRDVGVGEIALGTEFGVKIPSAKTMARRLGAAPSATAGAETAAAAAASAQARPMEKFKRILEEPQKTRREILGAGTPEMQAEGPKIHAPTPAPTRRDLFTGNRPTEPSVAPPGAAPGAQGRGGLTRAQLLRGAGRPQPNGAPPMGANGAPGTGIPPSGGRASPPVGAPSRRFLPGRSPSPEAPDLPTRGKAGVGTGGQQPALPSLGAAGTPRTAAAGAPLSQRPMDIVAEGMRGRPAAEARAALQRRAAARASKNPLPRVVQALRRTFSPENVDKASGRAAATVSETHGLGRRDNARMKHEVDKFYKEVYDLSQSDQIEISKYMTTRGKGAVLPPHLRHMQDAASAIRDAYNLRGAKWAEIGGPKSPLNKAATVDDFIDAGWTDQKAYEALEKQLGREPTFEEGLNNGLVPRTYNPIDMLYNYADTHDRLIAKEQAFKIGRKSQDIKYFKQAAAPEGWTPLKGFKPNRGGAIPYAPDSYARIFNRAYGKGWHDDPFPKGFGPIMDKILHATNMQTAVNLAMSAWHATLVSGETFTASLARGWDEATHGYPGMAAKTLAKAPLKPFEPYLRPITGGAAKLFGAGPTIKGTGRKVIENYMGIANHGAKYDKISDLLTRSDFNIGDYSAMEKTGFGGASAVQMFKRGTLGAEMKLGLKTMGNLKRPVPAALQTWQAAAKTTDLAMSPLFNILVPELKAGIAHDDLASWLARNPGATEIEELLEAQKISKSVDNRVGEMTHDNIFWPKLMKQAAMLGLLSYSWTLGTIREGGGGMFDIVSGKNTKKAGYVIGLFMTQAMIGGIVQYLKTGKAPESLQDLFAPQTGGWLPPTRFTPLMQERERFPTQLNVLWAYLSDPKQAFSNEVKPSLKMLGKIITMTDWRGDTQIDPKNQTISALQHTMNSITEGFTPIVFQQLQKSKENPKSNIGGVERFFGGQPATKFMQDPKGYEAAKRAVQSKAYEQTLYHKAAAAQNAGDKAEYARIMMDIKRRRKERQAAGKAQRQGGIQ